MYALALTTTVVLACLSLLHVYWAAGGVAGIDSVIPTVDGKRTLDPSPLASVVVATALAVAAAVVFASTGTLRSVAPMWFVRVGLVVLAMVFLARAIGDFRMIGFTKRIRDTRFARMDYLVFSPLCASLSIACGTLAVYGTP
ncbi:MAG TPA: DUF3995 domain-containing protein [Blastocatellia bacterium]|nr:DUF3995 domain-containing protein [Blastocatellia bacterium]